MICCYTIKIVSIKIYVKVILFLGSTDQIKQSWKKRKKEKKLWKVSCSRYILLIFSWYILKCITCIDILLIGFYSLV